MAVTRSQGRREEVNSKPVDVVEATQGPKEKAQLAKGNQPSAHGKGRNRTHAHPSRPDLRRKTLWKAKQEYLWTTNGVLGYAPVLSVGKDLTAGKKKIRKLNWSRGLTRRCRTHRNHSVYRVPCQIPEKTLQYLTDLHIPVLPPYSYSWSLQRCLAYLQWSIDINSLVWDSAPGVFNDVHYEGISARDNLDKYRRDNGPLLSTIPSELIEQNLDEERFRIHERLRAGFTQIPMNWKPIQGLPLAKRHPTYQGTSNSEPGSPVSLSSTDAHPPNPPTSISSDVSNPARGHQGSSSYVDANRTIQVVYTTAGDRNMTGSASKNAEFTLISCKGEANHKSSLRMDWEMLITIEASVFDWKFKDPESLYHRDQVRRTGNIALNDSSDNQDMRATGAIARFMSIYHIDSEVNLRKELASRISLGRRIADLMSSETLPAQCSFSAQKSLPAGYARIPPEIDVVCLPTTSTLSWAPSTQPILLVAQYSDGDERVAIEQVAEVLHHTLVLFILYYLDRRKTVDEMIPTWMILYGIIYNEAGFSIQEFYPALCFNTKKTSKGAPHFSWRGSSGCAANFSECFIGPPYDRGSAIAAILRIRSHALSVLQRFKEWDSFGRLIEPNLV